MKELRKTVEAAPAYPPILFFYQSSVADGEAFFQRLWPEARAVSDPDKTFYTAFGLERAGLKQMFGPEVVACGLRAAKNGSYGGKPVGDTRMMPGAFLVQRGSRGREEMSIVWTHTYRHIADHPSFQEIGQQLDTTQRAETK